MNIYSGIQLYDELFIYEHYLITLLTYSIKKSKIFVWPIYHIKIKFENWLIYVTITRIKTEAWRSWKMILKKKQMRKRGRSGQRKEKWSGTTPKILWSINFWTSRPICHHTTIRSVFLKMFSLRSWPLYVDFNWWVGWTLYCRPSYKYV